MFNTNRPIAGSNTVASTFDFIAGYAASEVPTLSEVTTFGGFNSYSAVLNSDITVIDGAFLNTVDKVLFMAEPLTEPVKTNWYNDVFNNDEIGPTHVFIVATIGTYRVYYTEFPTTFTGDVIFQQIT